MDIQARIDEARTRFAKSLIGRWSTAQGTFDMVMGQHWEIRADGTGKFIDTGTFGYPNSETEFEWQQVEDFVFTLRVTAFVAHEPRDMVHFDDEDREWTPIRYDFVPVNTDCGVTVGMIEASQRGGEFEGFFLSLVPLSYRGPV